MENKSKQNLLRSIARIVLLVGASSSLYFMFNAGSHQKSILLIVLFTSWVLSPFAGLFVAEKILKQWPYLNHKSIYWLMIVLSLGSMLAYSGIFTFPGKRPAFIFLVAPFLSWIVIGTAFLLLRRMLIIKNKTNQV